MPCETESRLGGQIADKMCTLPPEWLEDRAIFDQSQRLPGGFRWVRISPGQFGRRVPCAR